MAETKIYIDDEIDRQLREKAMARFGYGRGSISHAVEEAIAQWLAREDAIKGALEAIVGKAKRDRNIIAVLLFGSYAKKSRAFRDVDIALVLINQDKSNLPAYHHALEGSGALYKVDIDLVILNNMPLTVQGEILDEATELYVADKDAFYEYCVSTMKGYDSAARMRSILSS